MILPLVLSYYEKFDEVYFILLNISIRIKLLNQVIRFTINNYDHDFL